VAAALATVAAAAALAAFRVIPGIVMEEEGGGLGPSFDSFLALVDGCSCGSRGASSGGVVAVLGDDDLRLPCREMGGGKGGGAGWGLPCMYCRLGVLQESIRNLCSEGMARGSDKLTAGSAVQLHFIQSVSARRFLAASEARGGAREQMGHTKDGLLAASRRLKRLGENFHKFRQSPPPVRLLPAERALRHHPTSSP